MLKLGIFGINLRGGVTLADVEGNVQGTWDENVRLAQWADRLGLDAVGVKLDGDLLKAVDEALDPVIERDPAKTQSPTTRP